MVQMCIRWLGGGSYHDIRIVSGVSRAAFYSSVHKVIAAIIAHPKLQINFPSGHHALEGQAQAFALLSNNGVMRKCVGAIDGWLCSHGKVRSPE